MRKSLSLINYMSVTMFTFSHRVILDSSQILSSLVIYTIDGAKLKTIEKPPLHCVFIELRVFQNRESILGI